MNLLENIPLCNVLLIHVRCIIRATKQWFVSLDRIQHDAVRAVDGVHMIPESGFQQNPSPFLSQFLMITSSCFLGNSFQARVDFSLHLQPAWSGAFPGKEAGAFRFLSFTSKIPVIQIEHTHVFVYSYFHVQNTIPPLEGEPLLTRETVNHVQKLVAEKGSDCWWDLSVAELLPESYGSQGQLCIREHSLKNDPDN